MRIKLFLTGCLTGLIFTLAAQWAMTQESVWHQLKAQQMALMQQNRLLEASSMGESLVWLAQQDLESPSTGENGAAPLSGPLLESREILARSYLQQGDYTKARGLLEDLLDHQESAADPSHPRQSETLLSLAQTYASQGNPRPADEYFRRALKLQGSRQAILNPDLLKTGLHIGDLYRLQGDVEAAESLYQVTLQTKADLLGDQHNEVAAFSRYLGEFYAEQGDWMQAEALYRQAMAAQELNLGGEHIRVGTLSLLMGNFYERLGNSLQSKEYLDRGLEVLSKAFGLRAEFEEREQLAQLAQSLERRASIYQDLGLHYKALKAIEQSLQVYESLLGKDHLKLAPLLEGYAGILREVGQENQAQVIEGQANRIRLNQ